MLLNIQIECKLNSTYNTGKTGLYFRNMTNKLLTLQNKICKSRKMAKSSCNDYVVWLGKKE